MVGLVLVSHSRELGTALARLAAQTAPIPIPVAVAAGAGSGRTELGTDALAIAQAIRSVHGPNGVLVLMDLGSAVLAAETALELLPEEIRGTVRLCPAPLVEGSIAAAVQIARGSELEAVCREASQALAPKQDHLAEPGTAPQPSAAEGPDIRDGFLEAEATVRSAHGLHLRPAARLVSTAARFRAEVQVRKLDSDKPPVSAASLNSLATLGLEQGDRIVFRARGPDARPALNALRRLAEERFGETAGTLTLRQEAPAEPGERPGALQGSPVSEGFAAGPVQFLRQAVLRPSDRPPLTPEQEWAGLLEAVNRERASLDRERREAGLRAVPERSALLEAFRLVLEDPALLEPVRKAIFAGRQNAEQALELGIRQTADRYQLLADPYGRQRTADILELGQRVLRRLRRVEAALPEATEPVLLAAGDLPPTIAARLDPSLVAGVLTVRGGVTSHGSVLVRALGIPCVSGLPSSLLELPAGTTLAMDGGAGRVWVSPDPPTLARVQALRSEWQRRKTAAEKLRFEPASSRDGRHFEVEANIAAVADARLAADRGADGVGVLRTEFLFLDRPPAEEEQLEALRQTASGLQGRPLTVRTLDIGGDKAVPYLETAVESNPYLGVRGVRLCLRRPEFFRVQLRAVLRAADRHDLRLLFPMITTLEELEGALQQLALARAELERSGTAHRWPIPIGVMVETPSAAILIDKILVRADFVSVGTNDLTQYTLAAERGNPDLAGYEDALHPAVLAQIRRVAVSAARRGRTAAVCGEIAADPQAVPVLAGLGIGAFSLNPHGIPRVKDTLRRLDSAAAARLAGQALRCRTAAEVRRRAGEFYEALPPA